MKKIWGLLFLASFKHVIIKILRNKLRDVDIISWSVIFFLLRVVFSDLFLLQYHRNCNKNYRLSWVVFRLEPCSWRLENYYDGNGRNVLWKTSDIRFVVQCFAQCVHTILLIKFTDESSQFPVLNNESSCCGGPTHNHFASILAFPTGISEDEAKSGNLGWSE